MAKVCGVIIGLYYIFLLIIGISDSQNIQSTDYYSYDSINTNNNGAANVIHEIHFRDKRQISREDVAAIPKTTTTTTTTINTDNVPATVLSAAAATTTTTATTNDTNTNAGGILISEDKIQRPLLGVNGTGQRKDIVQTLSTATPTKISLGATSVVTQNTNDNNTITNTNNRQLTLLYPADNTGPEKPVKLNTTEYAPDDFVAEFDRPDKDTSIEAAKNNITNLKEDFYQYYNSTIIVDQDNVKQYWENLKNMTVNSVLSKSHRRAITLQLSFDFPFYGHLVRNITVATGGFLYTGEYVHSWLAATQYIAPLMANFDTSISNDSFVKYNDNGTSFTVLWENVSLQDKQNVGTFTFSVSLYKTGDIRFVYYSLPIQIESILDDKHPVKIGLSDAYIIDKTIFFARRKTIYEYHRVNFEGQDIANNTIITLTAQPTCLSLTNCQQCVDNLATTFKCAWCPALNKCSTGTDRKRQEWIQKNCDKVQITNASVCAPIGTKGNNYGQMQEIEIKDVSNGANDGSGGGGGGSVNGGAAGEKWIHTHPMQKNDLPNDVNLKSSDSMAQKENGGVGLVVGLFIPILLVFTLVVWVFYAYRNPHTKSGQLLIQYRPSQWSWRRGEARYTAATIHM